MSEEKDKRANNLYEATFFLCRASKNNRFKELYTELLWKLIPKRQAIENKKLVLLSDAYLFCGLFFAIGDKIYADLYKQTYKEFMELS